MITSADIQRSLARPETLARDASKGYASAQWGKTLQNLSIPENVTQGSQSTLITGLASLDPQSTTTNAADKIQLKLDDIDPIFIGVPKEAQCEDCEIRSPEHLSIEESAKVKEPEYPAKGLKKGSAEEKKYKYLLKLHLESEEERKFNKGKAIIGSIENELDKEVKNNKGEKLSKIVISGHGDPDEGAVMYHVEGKDLLEPGEEREGSFNIKTNKALLSTGLLAEIAAERMKPGGDLIFDACSLLRNDLSRAERKARLKELQAIADKYGINIHVAQSDMNVSTDDDGFPEGEQQANGRFLIIRPHQKPKRDVQPGDATLNKADYDKFDKKT